MNEVSVQTKYTPRKFYFIEYFYIFLKSIRETSSNDRAFDLFRQLKEELALGESKFKTRARTQGDPTKRQLERYRYTFNQVAEESRTYKLAKGNKESTYGLTNDGQELLDAYGTPDFRFGIIERMERHYGAFRYLLETMYRSNPNNGGVLLFPLYSPLELGIQKRDITCAEHLKNYGDELGARVKNDLATLTGTTIDLPDANKTIIPKLKEAEKLPADDRRPFPRNEYTAIISRYRKFWFSYLLQNVYGVELSESTFEVWVYRGKQLGTINVTEQYPGLNGRLAYPVSIVRDSAGEDFCTAFSYNDATLWLHEPSPDSFLNRFVDNLTEAYVSQRRSAQSYFTSLYVLREIVCLKCKLSEKRFELLLNAAYEQSIQGALRIRISLEVDRTPGETSATYLRREPVLIRSQPFNIIGIDFASSISDE